MAADFWQSRSSLALVTKLHIVQSHLEDRARGLTDGQINQLNLFFATQIWELAAMAKMRHRVAATAIMYFRRFYLRNSFGAPDKDPRLIHVGCLYLASKAEESLLAAKYFVSYAQRKYPGWPYEVKHVLDAEMMLLKDLDFNLVVFNPYRPLQSYLMDAGAPQEIAQAAWAALNDSFKCDAPLMYPPHVLALGCLVFAASVAPLRASLVPPPEQLPAHPGQQQIQGMGSLPDSHGAAAQQHATPAYAPGAAMGAATGQTDPGLTAAPPGPGGTSGAATSLATSDGKLLQAQGPTLLAAPHQQAPGASTGAAGGDGSVAAWDVGQWLATVNIDLEQVYAVAQELAALYEGTRVGISITPEECCRLLDVASMRLTAPGV